MWYTDKEGDAYLIKDLKELRISENPQDDDTIAYNIEASFESTDDITLATLPTREDCFKFRDWFLTNYIRNEAYIIFANFGK